MLDNAAGLPNAAVVRAVRFPSTARALASISGAWLPWSYAVVADANRLRIVSWRRSDVVLDLPASSIQEVVVGETATHWYQRRVALAIILTVRTGNSPLRLPIVPVSDDGKRSLVWQDAEVRALARRLTDVLAL